MLLIASTCSFACYGRIKGNAWVCEERRVMGQHWSGKGGASGSIVGGLELLH